MEENKTYSAKEALVFLKGGYLMKLLFRDREYQVVYHSGKVHLKNPNEGIALSEYEFLSLYGPSVFLIDHSNMEEESVDMKKDEEYYSWKQ